MDRDVGTQAGRERAIVNRMRTVVVLLVAVVASGLVWVAPAGAESCQVHDTQPTRTFAVRTRVADDAYSVGDTVKFRVRVMRSVDGTDVGPARGAEVAVFVEVDDVTLAAGSTTDEEGRAVVKIRLAEHLNTGDADVSVRAHKHLFDVPCHTDLEHEFGSKHYPNLFTVR